jgi:hypothetical protein
MTGAPPVGATEADTIGPAWREIFLGAPPR